MADDAGALLVRSGLVTTTALEAARARVVELGGTIGEQLVLAGGISDDDLTAFYSTRLLVPQVNPNALGKLSVRVVAALSQDLAIELRAIPVSFDAENTLTVAMSDPSDAAAVDEIAFFTGASVIRAVATQMQIAWCLAHYYNHVTPLGQRLLKASAGASVAAVSPQRPRTKGLTGQVDAQRRRAMAPVTGPVAAQRGATARAEPASAEAAGLVAQAPAQSAAPVSQIPAFLANTPRIGPAAAVMPVAVPPSDEPSPDPGAVPQRQPRAHSISGEIRVPGRRAPSIKPELPRDEDDDDESGPIITVEVNRDEDPTGPRKVAPRRRRAVKSDPPELAARAGEIGDVAPIDRSVDAEPRIIIADDLDDSQADATGEIELRAQRNSGRAPTQTIEVSDDEGGTAVIQERYDAPSAPILLDASMAPTPRPPVLPAEDVVELADKKPAAREKKQTQVGMGAVPAVTRTHRDTEAGIPQMLDDDPTSVTQRLPEDPTAVDMRAASGAPPADHDDDDDDVAEPPLPAPPRAPSEHNVADDPEDHDDDEDDDDEDDEDPDDDRARGNATAVMSAIELDEVIPQRSTAVVPAHLAKMETPGGKWVAHDELDDGWGPPGTTIPPPLLGAIPGGAFGDAVPGRIPMPDIDSAPLIVAPPAPPEISRGSPRAQTANSTPVRAIEDATARMLDLIRALETSESRDDAVALMVTYLAETHRRAGFFVVKPTQPKGATELTPFSMLPKPAIAPYATMRLDHPSTLQDVVGTRLPYRGPMHDAASRQFLATVLGATPPEILLVPVLVRDRVVGVLFGEHRLHHTFDDQLALAARAAGYALERILLTKRT